MDKMTQESKKRITVDRLQNLAIVLLSLSAALLFLQTPLFGDFGSMTPFEFAESFFSPSQEEDPAAAVELSGLAAPVRIVFTNDFSRCGADTLTVLDSDFSRIGSFLGEALGSAGTMIPSSEAAFLAALRQNGIYFDFTAGVPLSVLCEALGTSTPISHDASVRRALLSPNGDISQLYLLDQSGACYSFSTALSGTELSEYLESLDGTRADFAFSRPEEYGALSPFTLIMDEPSPRSVLTASNALSGTDLSTLLRLAEFNPHTENRYTESTGTTVVRESYGTLSLAPDGTVTYHSGTSNAGALYTVASERDSVSLTEAVAAAHRLVSTILQGSSGDASLYLSDAEITAKGYSITLDYVVNGTPLRFSDGSHAACVTIEKRSITDFSLCMRSYTLSDDPALLLPIRQAAAIAQSAHENSELSVCYVDSGADTVSVSWIAEE